MGRASGRCCYPRWIASRRRNRRSRRRCWTATRASSRADYGFAKQAEVSDPTVSFCRPDRLSELLVPASAVRRDRHGDELAARADGCVPFVCGHARQSFGDFPAAVRVAGHDDRSRCVRRCWANPDVRVAGRYTAPLASLFSFTLAYARPHVQYVEPNVNSRRSRWRTWGLECARHFRFPPLSAGRYSVRAGRASARHSRVADHGRMALADRRICRDRAADPGQPFAMLQTNVPARARQRS